MSSVLVIGIPASVTLDLGRLRPARSGHFNHGFDADDAFVQSDVFGSQRLQGLALPFASLFQSPHVLLQEQEPLYAA
jgi:hypothetical protein